MCPLRFLLVLFSAAVAGYLAWRTIQSPSPSLSLEERDRSKTSSVHSTQLRGYNSKRVVVDGFWGFLDMASGRYLWRLIKERSKVTLKPSGEVDGEDYYFH